MQRDYQGLNHNFDIWLSGQRAKKIVRFKPVNGNKMPPAYAHRDQERNPYIVSMVGAKSLL